VMNNDGPDDPGPDDPVDPWWLKLPAFVQWLLRIFAFGWIWMK